MSINATNFTDSVLDITPSSLGTSGAISYYGKAYVGSASYTLIGSCTGSGTYGVQTFLQEGANAFIMRNKSNGAWSTTDTFVKSSDLPIFENYWIDGFDTAANSTPTKIIKFNSSFSSLPFISYSLYGGSAWSNRGITIHISQLSSTQVDLVIYTGTSTKIPSILVQVCGRK